MAPGSAIRIAPILALLLCVPPLSATAQLAPPRGQAEQFGDQLAATQQFMQGRWLALVLPLMANKNLAKDVPGTLGVEARRMGTRGPTPQDWTALDAELTRQIDAYLNFLESVVRNGQAKWPRDRSRTSYDNGALILIESIRIDAKTAIARREDVLPAMMRASKLHNWVMGEAPWNHFFGREESIEIAMRTIKMTTPRPQGR